MFDPMMETLKVEASHTQESMLLQVIEWIRPQCLILKITGNRIHWLNF